MTGSGPSCCFFTMTGEETLGSTREMVVLFLPLCFPKNDEKLCEIFNIFLTAGVIAYLLNL